MRWAPSQTQPIGTLILACAMPSPWAGQSPRHKTHPRIELSHLPRRYPAYGGPSQSAFLRASGRVRYEDLRIQTAAELALQSGPKVGEGRALGVLRSRLLGLVLLDHDQPVVSLVQCVEFNARFVVNPGDRRLKSRDHLSTVLGDGKGCDHDNNAHVRCSPPVGDHPFRGALKSAPGWSYRVPWQVTY